MDEIAKKYYDRLIKLLGLIRVTDYDSTPLDFYQGIGLAAQLVTANTSHKMIFIGNGASAAIASHMSTDFWKMGGGKGDSLQRCLTPNLYQQ